MEEAMKNGVMLITYPDSMGSNLSDLDTILSKHFSKALTSLHILPFFPSSGDRGFAPYTYEEVDPAFGSWKDIDHLAETYDLVFDYMINHISAKSPLLKEYLAEGPDSPSKDYFIDYETFWGGEPTEEQIQKIYKRKPKDPYETVTFSGGEKRKLWCTFSEEQIDLNVQTDLGESFMEANLARLAQHGAKIVRLDAFAYAFKKKDTDCFFVEPETWQLLAKCRSVVEKYGSDVLPEIHEHYSIQLKLASHSYPVYDFALPMLMLHALYFHQTQYLKNWFAICPRNQYTTLDTHDGIGVVDVYGLLPDEEIEATKEHLYDHGANVKRIYNSETYNNLDIYQINCTYYSALGEDDRAYLLARAVQFFSPGIPQIYYVGMLAGSNDLELLERTKEGRNINRHYYTKEEVDEAVQRPVVVALRLLMELRSSHPAFDGIFQMEEPTDEEHLIITWEHRGRTITLNADFASYSFTIEEGDHTLMRL